MPGQYLEREGLFRLEPKDWYARQHDSGTVSVNIRFDVLSQYFPEDSEWKDWPAGYEVWGRWFPVGKSGDVNERATSDLIRYIGWNGDLAMWSDTAWVPNKCQGRVKSETYEGKTRFKVEFLDYFDAVPRQGNSNAMSADDLKALQNRLGGKFRAIAGNVARDNAAPAGKDIPF